MYFTLPLSAKIYCQNQKYRLKPFIPDQEERKSGKIPGTKTKKELGVQLKKISKQPISIN